MSLLRFTVEKKTGKSPKQFAFVINCDVLNRVFKRRKKYFGKQREQSRKQPEAAS